MGKSSCVLQKDNALINGIELCEYLKTKDFRKKLLLYKFETSLIAKNSENKNYKELEKEFSNEILKKNKKIIKL